MEKRLQTEGPVVPFTLPPEAVLKKVMQDKVLEQIQQSMQEGGHEADIRVLVL